MAVFVSFFIAYVLIQLGKSYLGIKTFQRTRPPEET